MLEELGFDRDVLQPVVTFGKDHVRLDFPPAAQVLALRRSLIVPYSTIRDVRASDPEWPSWWHLQRVGTHVPGRACLGSFWVEGERRLYYFFRHDRVLVLDLEDHPYAQLVLGTPEPDVLAADIKSRLEGDRGSETQSF